MIQGWGPPGGVWGRGPRGPGALRAIEQMLCNATVEPIRVNDGGEKEAKENGNNDDRQTDKRRLLEMPWPKGRHLKIRLALPSPCGAA